MQRYQEIQTHNAAQAIRMASCYSNTDEIRKGEISDKLANGWGGGDQIKFRKTGKEIKAKLPTIDSTLNNEKMVVVAEMAGLRSTIGSEPSEEFNEKKFKMLRYPWKMCDAAYDPIGRSYCDPTDENKSCQKYNDLCWKLLDIERDLEATKVMAANLDDEKTYDLTVGQLVALCFNE